MRRDHQRKTKFLDANYLIGTTQCLARATTDLHPKGAFLYAEGEEMVWGHSVAELCKRATTKDKELEKVRRKAATLDKYYIPTRYPNGLPRGIPSEAFEKRDADRAIEIAEEVIKVIDGKL